MNSAPAILRMPALELESDDIESYPWAVNTPEASPRWREVAPSMDCSGMEAPAQQVLSAELMRAACAPYYEQMCCSVAMQQMPAKCMASRDELRTMCEPYFGQMVNALHQSTMQATSDSGFQPIFYPMMPYFRMDDQSTDAEDSCAFTSLFSGQSSESPRSSRSEFLGETTVDVEKSIMVCRHWKSKGFCRLESKCKFLHPEHKCGIDAAAASGVAGGQLDSTARPKKRGGKNKSNRRLEQGMEQELA